MLSQHTIEARPVHKRIPLLGIIDLLSVRCDRVRLVCERLVREWHQAHAEYRKGSQNQASIDDVIFLNLASHVFS
jgi:hypothetical protein